MTHEVIDPTYGYDREALLAVDAPVPPGDFADFWSGRYDEAMAAPVTPHRIGTGVPSGRWTTYDVEFGSLGGVRLGGWLQLPSSGTARRGLVVGHGYGGREAPEPELPVGDDVAVLSYCTRGLPSRGLLPGIPDTAAFHVLHGISSRESYLHGLSAADLWCAATALLALVPEAGARGLAYLGGSFGGGVGALALPWDPRFSAACLVVPSFGNHPLRFTMPSTGSGEAVRRHLQRHPETAEVLRYFDAATAATFLRTPTHVAAALADPAVPPPGQFAIYNALAGSKELFVTTAGHMEYSDLEDEHREVLAAQRAFLDQVDR